MFNKLCNDLYNNSHNSAPSEWMVGEDATRYGAIYCVYRLKDAGEPDQEDNREVRGNFSRRERAEEFAGELNEREGRGDVKECDVK